MALAWSLGGQPAAQLISPLFWVSFPPASSPIARSCNLSNAAAFAGVVAAAMMPFAHWSGSNSKNDSAMVFFQAAALLAFLRSARNPQPGMDSRRCASAWIHVRHQARGLVRSNSTGMLLPVRDPDSIPRLRLALAFCSIFAVSALYWPARTAYLTGNPVYPASLSQSLDLHEKGVAKRRVPRFLRIPWYAYFNGWRVFESPLPNPMGLALLVFLPLAILVPRQRTPTRRACWLFCAVYLAYWIPMAGMLRYAILPISLVVSFFSLAKPRLFTTGWRGRLLRATVAGAFAGALLFAALGIAIIEVNAPMLLLFARRIGPDQYLDMALRTHKSLAWLAAAHPGSSIFGIDNCSRAYAPDPAKFYCALHGWHGAEPGLARCRCEYVVQPSGQRPGREAVPVFRDAYFTVWQLGVKGDATAAAVPP